MCLCLSVALIFPTGRPVQSPPDVSRRAQEPGAEVRGCHCLLTSVLLGRRACSQQLLLAVRSPILHNSPGGLPPPGTDWSEVITGPQWLNTRDTKRSECTR